MPLAQVGDVYLTSMQMASLGNCVAMLRPMVTFVQDKSSCHQATIKSYLSEDKRKAVCFSHDISNGKRVMSLVNGSLF